MSREVIARTTTARGHDAGPPDPEDTGGPDLHAAGPRGLTRDGADDGRSSGSPRRRAAALAALAALAVAVGWSGQRAWSGSQDAAAARVGRAEAVAAGPMLISPERGRTRLAWQVVVANPGGDPVEVRFPRPGEVPPEDPGFVDASRRDVVVAPGTQARVAVESVVTCAGADPLRVPALRVDTTPRGGPDAVAVPVTGAFDLAVGACADQPAGTRVLTARVLGSSPTVLTVALASPTGRPWDVLAASAAGVPLGLFADGDPERDGGDRAGTTVDEDGAVVRLARAPGTPCPTDWLEVGVPQRLSVTLAGPEPVDVDLPLGPDLSAWLLGTHCGPASRSGRVLP